MLVYVVIWFYFLQVELCLRLVKRFSEKNFEPQLLECDDHLDKGQQLKFGRTILNVDQIVELPIDNQIYDMVDAEGSEGLPVMTVCAYIFLTLLYYKFMILMVMILCFCQIFPL